MKIALFTDTFEKNLGGVTVYVRALADYLEKAGHTVKVFVWDSKGLSVEDKKMCIIFSSIGAVEGVNGRAGFAPHRIFQEIRKFLPDVIHNHSQYTMGLHAILVAKSFHIPLVQHYHMYLKKVLHYLPDVCQISPKYTNYSIDKLTAIFLNRGDIVVVPSDVMKKYLISIGVNKKIQVIPFGIDLECFRVNKKENRKKRFTVLHVGRLSKEKKVNEIIKIFARFSTDKKIQLKIIGDGPEKDNLKCLTKLLKIDKKVTFSGWIPRKNLPKEYNDANVFITLSDMETFGIVIVEAMACGLPVIGSNALAIPELIVQDRNGYLVNINDRNDILNKLNKIYYDKNLEIRLSKNASKFAERFEEGEIFQKLEHIYQSVVS